MNVKVIKEEDGELFHGYVNAAGVNTCDAVMANIKGDKFGKDGVLKGNNVIDKAACEAEVSNDVIAFGYHDAAGKVKFVIKHEAVSEKYGGLNAHWYANNLFKYNTRTDRNVNIINKEINPGVEYGFSDAKVEGGVI